MTGGRWLREVPECCREVLGFLGISGNFWELMRFSAICPDFTAF